MYDELVEASGIEVPEKVFFRIGEVSDLTEVKAYVLRFWEKEFPSLRPQKGKTGQRRYRRTDILEIARIKMLLWERKFTIQGAKDDLKRRKQAKQAPDEDRVTTLQVEAPTPSATAPSIRAVQSTAEIVAARAELDAAREAAGDLRSALSTAMASLETSRAERARSEGEAGRLASKLEESESDLSALRAAHDQLAEQYALMATDSARLSADLVRLQSQSMEVAAAARSPHRDELLAVREELIRLKARLGTRLPTLS